MDITKEIELIKERNRKVELEKAWETSLTRKIAIAITTYIFMCVLMYTLEVKDFYLSAIVPTCGFLLSTLSLPMIKNLWLKKKSLQRS